MKLLVCGGRGYEDAQRVFAVLDRVHEKEPITLVIQGGARGADRLGGLWAKNRGIHTAAVEALWDSYGKAAGSKRNAAMAEILQPDGCVAFPGGRGTADMVQRCKQLGIKVMEVTQE